jgi:DNA polymerase III epsilon subunit-like protein
MKVLAFDTETTDLIANRTLPLNKQPAVWEFFGIIGDLATGEIEKQLHHLIRPSRAFSEESLKMAYVTEEDLAEKPYFSALAPEIKEFIETGPRPMAHNAAFDVDMIEVEFERLGQTVKWGGRPICTIERTVHLRGYRLKLADLHDYLFSHTFKDAHRAENDVMAMFKCACELFKRGEL